MASSHGLKPQSDLRNSTGILSATIKHIAEGNPIKLAEATGRFLTETIRCYITTPFPWITSSSFIITAAIIIVSIIFLRKFGHTVFRELFPWNEEQPVHVQLRREKALHECEKLLCECEEQLEREEAEWQRRKDQVIRERPQDTASLEYISGQPEEF